MLADASCAVGISVFLQSRERRDAFSKNDYFAWLTLNAYARVDVSPVTVACHRDETKHDVRVND
jgi:hypothetical protein